MRAGLQGTMRIKGLLEMMFEVLSDWIDAFIEDIEEVEGSETGNTTPKGSISPRDSRGEHLWPNCPSLPPPSCVLPSQPPTPCPDLFQEFPFLDIGDTLTLHARCKL